MRANNEPAVLCSDDGKALSNEHMVFFNQLRKLGFVFTNTEVYEAIERYGAFHINIEREDGSGEHVRVPPCR